MKIRILIIFYILFVVSCNKKNASNSENYTDFNSIIENDTLSFEKNPENLTSWLEFYKTNDTLFTLSNFKASGVILHISELKIADTISVSNLPLKPLFEYAPDGLSYIDLWSYGNKNIPDKAWKTRSELAKSIKNGEPDQQIVLGMKDGKRYELIFNGPTTFTEFADWINNDQFLISQNTKDNNSFIIELFVFDIKEMLFTNYRLNHTPTFNFERESYFDHWINKTNKLLK